MPILLACIPSHSETRLIYCAWDEATDVPLIADDVW